MSNIDREEKQRISWWKERLESCTPGWEIGDKKGNGPKTADIVNHSCKIALELKREKGGSLDNQNENLDLLSNRLEPRIRDANEKFKQYHGYRTILIIELDTNVISAQVVMSGLPSFHFWDGNFVGQSIKNKKLHSGVRQTWDEVGAIILWPSLKNNWSGLAFYFNHPSAKADRRVFKDEAEKIIGRELQSLDLLS